MASEYSVNIKLNTKQVQKDLKTIGNGISNLNKKKEKGSKQALTAEQKELKLLNTSLGLRNRGFALQIKALGLQKKGVDIAGVEKKLDEASSNAKKYEFDLSRKSLLMADKEMKKAQLLLKINEDLTKSKGAQVKLQRQLASPIGGSKYMMGSPAQMAFSGGLSSPIGGSRFIAGSPAQLAFSAKTGGPRSPIGGSTSIPGSPAFLANQGKSKGILSSALISGGFPLLFGQGPAGALAGGLGGGIGAAVGGKDGGFAGGIAATAVLQSITTLTQNISKLGNALSRPTENIGALVEKLGLANDPTGRLALKLEKLGLTSSASALLMEQFTKQTGKTPDMLQNAAQEINEMNKSLATFNLKLQLLASEALLPIIDALNKIPFGSIGKKIKPISDFILFGPGGNPSETLNKMKGISNIPASEGNPIINGKPLNPDFGKTSAQIGKTSALEGLAKQAEFNQNILPLQQSLQIEQQRFSLTSQQLTVKQEANKLDLKSKELEMMKKEAAILNNGALDLKIEKLTAEANLQKQIYENALVMADPVQAQTVALDQQMTALMDRGSQVVALSQTIAGSFEESFKGIVNGTMSIKDAFRNMLDSIANHFINTAAKMMANRLQSGLLGMLGGVFGGGGGFMGSVGNSKLTGAFSGGGGISPLLGFASGGRPPVGRPSIVGERGPELFVPRSAGTVVPNEKIGGSSITNNISISVDASGSNVQSEEEGQQFGEALATAIQLELVKQKRSGGLLA